MSAAKKSKQNPEADRVLTMGERRGGWRRWGPYLSERQWGTVREDYSASGQAWEYLPHDHARSRAYRWGEDGIAGFSDEEQRLCLAVAMWNGRDPILKERLFGVSNSEGNHGEDVKELYYYLDGTPSHSYLRMLYKYPQAEFPYGPLLGANRERSAAEPESELLDTGIFDEDRYFDVFIEYAKATEDEVLMRVTAVNRGPDPAPLHLVPQIWFRNEWSFDGKQPRPRLDADGRGGLLVSHATLGHYEVRPEGEPKMLLVDNDTNVERLHDLAREGRVFKDGIHDHIIQGVQDAVKTQGPATKAGLWYEMEVPPGGEVSVRLRLFPAPGGPSRGDFDRLMDRRRREADLFYADLQGPIDNRDARLVQRQALAGMIWSKQFYYYDVQKWLHGDPGQPTPPAERREGRNRDWNSLSNKDILSMPDKWEFPWYATWDLAFHCIPLALVDPAFAKDQLLLLTEESYMHANGQLPAYEWNFSDVNPPVHAWAAWRVFQICRKQCGAGDLEFLERIFHKLLINFTWWVNRKDADGKNVFQGGFLGLDNIGVFERSRPLPTGGHLDQSDGTSWMAMYSLNLMRIALELARHNHAYESVAIKFFEHFLQIAQSMAGLDDGHGGLWDEKEEFYFDHLHLPDGRELPLRLRSMVGLIPLFAVEVIEPELLAELPEFDRRLRWVLENRHEQASLVSRWDEPGRGERRLLSLLRGHRMKCLLRRMLDESEFLSDHGVRSLSKAHLEQPYELDIGDETLEVRYQPGESADGLYGGNSNWRGPVWFPVNYLLIESLQRFHHYYGDDFQVECPTGSGEYRTLAGVSQELTTRLTRIFLADSDGRRPVFGYSEKHQQDPMFRDLILFHEHFHGETGHGLGASHQTGWTGLIAKLLKPRDIR